MSIELTPSPERQVSTAFTMASAFSSEIYNGAALSPNARVLQTASTESLVAKGSLPALELFDSTPRNPVPIDEQDGTGPDLLLSAFDGRSPKPLDGILTWPKPAKDDPTQDS